MRRVELLVQPSDLRLLPEDDLAQVRIFAEEGGVSTTINYNLGYAELVAAVGEAQLKAPLKLVVGVLAEQVSEGTTNPDIKPVRVAFRERELTCKLLGASTVH